MSFPIEYRKGSLGDLSNLKFEKGLSVSAESIEFNVLGMGHEFWIAVQAGMVIGITVLGKEGGNEFRIMLLEVAPSRKKEGVGSALLQALIRDYSEYNLSVIPFEGTEDFYGRLGFLRVSRWEMRREPSLGQC
jgi:N-acetylglutamate synthase-like GNAT family acetyltransferase